MFLGHRATCFVGMTGARWCTGENLSGELGLGDLTNRQAFERAVDGENWKTINNFYGATHGIRNGRVWRWGQWTDDNTVPIDDSSADLIQAELGDVDLECLWMQDFTANCDAGHAQWRSIASGGSHTCGVTMADQRLFCQGENRHGSIGQPSSVASTQTMMEVGAGLGPWADVATGGNGSNGVTCARTVAGQLYCFGDPALTGTNGVDTAETPVLINSDTDWTWVQSRYERTCAGKADKRVFCWGTDTFGAFIVPGQHTVPVPTQVDGLYDHFVLGGHHACGQTTDGRWQCFGWNNAGQLGIGTTDTPDGFVGMCAAN